MIRSLFTLVDSNGDFAVPVRGNRKSVPAFKTYNRAAASMHYYRAEGGGELKIVMYTPLKAFTNTTSITGK